MRGMKVGAQLLVEPLWDISTNGTNPCSLDTNSTGGWILHGSETHACGLQVTATQGTHIQLQIPGSNASQKHAFVYIERTDLEYCLNKYVAFREQAEKCTTPLVSRNIQLTLQGNTNALITEIPKLESLSTRPESGDNVYLNVSQVSGCKNIKGYYHKITCDQQNGKCELNFPTDCNATLSYNEVLYENCDFDMVHRTAMILYHINIRTLNLTYNNIIDISANSFQSLKVLQELDLSGNYLVTLHAGVFRGLQTLIILNISWNKLEILEEQCFAGLYKLRTLHLWNNKLKKLPATVFQSFINLEYLRVHDNEIAILDANLFIGLGKLEYLWFRSNMLSVLPRLFQVTKNLQLLDIASNLIEVLHEELFQGLGSLRFLNLGNNMLTSLPNKLFQGLANLNVLSIAGNQVTNLSKETFEGLLHLQLQMHLQNLKINNNRIVKLNHDIFRGLRKLKILEIQFNQIKVLDRYLFKDLKNLSHLSLAHNNIVYLDRDIFKDTISLRFIDLSSNKLIDIPNIQDLINLNHFNVRGNTFVSISDGAFSVLSAGSKVFASQHEVCECYVPKYVNCSAANKRSPYLTCDRLLSNTVLVIVTWLIGLNAIGGNIFVFLWQKRQTRSNKVFTFLLRNLAASDFLMGIYMVIITFADLYFGDNFPMQSEAWRSGIICKIAGALSIISSEASVFFVTIISIDRFISIRFPFSTKKNRETIHSSFCYICLDYRTFIRYSSVGVIRFTL